VRAPPGRRAFQPRTGRKDEWLRPQYPKAKREVELKEVEPTDLHAERWPNTNVTPSNPSSQPKRSNWPCGSGSSSTAPATTPPTPRWGMACGAHHPVKKEDLDGSCKPYMADPDSSYGNDVTNVRKLMELYVESAAPTGEGSQKRLSRKVYIEGIGTQVGEEDSLLGAGMGRGETGVIGCVQKAFALIASGVTRAIQENPDCIISSLVFDTFGFSRGAAAARHFANEIVKGVQGPLRTTLHDNAKGFAPDFVERYQRGIDIGFIGLFDTVTSVGGLANLGNVRSAVAPGVNLHLPRKYFTDGPPSGSRRSTRQFPTKPSKTRPLRNYPARCPFRHWRRIPQRGRRVCVSEPNASSGSKAWY
jgi:hypothetical protein